MSKAWRLGKRRRQAENDVGAAKNDFKGVIKKKLAVVDEERQPGENRGISPGFKFDFLPARGSD